MVNDSLFISTVFTAGILSFFAPCILPLLPVYVSHLSVGLDGQESKTMKIMSLTLHPILILKTFLFVAGLSTSFIILGFGAGILGGLIYSPWLVRVAGMLVIVLGIHQMGLIHIKTLEREKKVRVKGSNKNGILGAYLLGFTFSLGWTPCIGPVLGAVLGVSASAGQGGYGAWLMFVYALGLMIPFMLLAIFSDVLLGKVKHLKRHMNRIKIVGGVIIVLMGVMLLTNQLSLITAFFEGLIQ